MKKRVITIALALIMAVSVIPATSFAATDLFRATGINLSTMNAEDTHGNTYTGEIFSKYQVTVLNIWATWCGPCKHEMPYFQQLYDEYEPYGVNVFGVLDEDYMSTLDRANDHLASNGYTYPSLRKTNDTGLKRIYQRGCDEGNNTIPMSFLVNNKGIVISGKSGAFVSYDELEAWINEYVDKPTPRQGLGVESHTKEEIQAFFMEHPARMDQAVTYSVEPGLTEPYGAGVLSEETVSSALNMLNQIRYIAGISHDISEDPQKSHYASSASLVNCLNNVMAHEPVRPSQLADSKYDQLYSDGYTGASNSNIAWGSKTINDAIVNGWMADEDSHNIERVGHRRWFLNPFMETTGFGMAGTHSAAYVVENSIFNDWNDTYVAWPAQKTPTRYFADNYPWSVSFGYKVNAGDVSVKLTRKSDNKTWNFSNASADGDFYVDCENYGSPACIIFRPSGLNGIKTGDVFDVTVVLDEDTTLYYSVEFFTVGYPGDMNGNDDIDVGDATLLLRYIVGLETDRTLDISLADINGDGRVNTGDAACILARIVGAK